MAVIAQRSVQAKNVGQNALVDIRPPAGETWVLASYDVSALINMDFYFVNGTITASTSLCPFCGYFPAGTPIDNANFWVQMKQNTATTVANVTVTAFVLPASISLVAKVFNTGAWDFRPPVGSVLKMVKGYWPNSTGNVNISDGTNTSLADFNGATAQQLMTQMLTNDLFLRITGTAQGAMVAALQLDASGFTFAKFFQSIAASAVVDWKPAAGETWCVFSANRNPVTLTVTVDNGATYNSTSSLDPGTDSSGSTQLLNWTKRYLSDTCWHRFTNGQASTQYIYGIAMKL